MIVDIYMVYSFLKRLVTPFESWDAYKEGVIDADGNILLKAKDRVKVSQRQSFGKFDLLVLKLKKLLEKVPGGKTRLASFAAALWLIKEGDELIEFAETLTEEEMMKKFSHYLIITEHNSNVNNRFELFEETNVTSVAPPEGLAKQFSDMGADYGKAKQKRKEMFKRKVQESLGRGQSTGGYGSVGSSQHNLGRGHSTDYKPKKAESKNPKPKPVVTKKSSTSTSNTSSTSTSSGNK